MPGRLIAVNATRAVPLTESARIADTMWTRMVGLLRDKELAEGDGLWIVPCNSIHSFAMKFDFDAIFLSRELEVVRLYPAMKPWRVSAVVLGAHSVLELPAGTIARTGTEMGDRLEMCKLA